MTTLPVAQLNAMRQLPPPTHVEALNNQPWAGVVDITDRFANPKETR